MEIIKNNITVNTPIKCGSTEISTDCDIIVPDIKPDILKLLLANGTAVITDSELTEGRLSVNGIIKLNILYLPDREEEKIKAINSSCSFSARIDKSELMPDMYASSEATVEKIDFQILNSRKLRIKTTVRIDYEISEHTLLELSSGIADENAEACVTPIELISLMDEKISEFSVKEDFELPPGHSAVEDILKCDASVCDAEYKLLNGRAVIKGTLCLSCLYLDISCCIKTCEFETEFTEIFDIEADEDTVCDINYFIKDTAVQTEADSDGDMRILSTSCEIGIKITATKKISTEILSDCFYPSKKTYIERTAAVIEKAISGGFYQSTIREIVPAPSDCPDIIGIYNVFASPEIEKSEISNNTVCISGNISCCILYISDSEATPVYSTKRNFPFSISIDTPGCSPQMEYTTVLKLIHTSFSLSPANEAEIRFILSASANVFERCTTELISDISISEPDENTENGIILYFVQKNESLWDISKQYSVSQNDILTINNLSSDTLLTDGMRLLIPIN